MECGAFYELSNLILKLDMYVVDDLICIFSSIG